MKAKHTPGPWTVSPSAKASTLTRIFSVNEERLVASASGPGLSESGEAEANARLIAAAPELLDALIEARHKVASAAAADAVKWTSDIIKVTEFVRDQCAKMDALIAKATQP